MRRLFTIACAVSAFLWLAGLLLAALRYLEFPLELGRAVADGVVALAVLGTIAALWVHMQDHERARAKRVTGFCGNCGYNLTGNVSGVCPECGTPVGKRDPSPSGNPVSHLPP